MKDYFSSQKVGPLSATVAIVTSVFFIVGIVQAATTISTNISTGGTLSVTGQSTLTGNVGIANSTPTYNLDVTGLGHFSGLVDAANLVATSTSLTSVFAGKMTIGTPPTTALSNTNLDMELSGGGGIGIASYRNSTLGGNVELVHARGTQASPSTLNIGDDGGNVYLSGYVSGGTKILGNIAGTYTGTDNKVEGALRFLVDQTPDEVMQITSSAVAGGIVAIGYNTGTTPAVATTTAAGMLQVKGKAGFGTTTPATQLQVSSGASATTTVTIGELGLTSSKACVNMNRSDGGAGSFYINAAGALVAEANYCK